jgi:hypothetical protein
VARGAEGNREETGGGVADPRDDDGCPNAKFASDRSRELSGKTSLKRTLSAEADWVKDDRSSDSDGTSGAGPRSVKGEGEPGAPADGAIVR